MQGREETRRTWRVSESAREKEPTVSLHLLGVKDTRASYAAKRTGLAHECVSCFFYLYIERRARTHTLMHTAHSTHTHTHSHQHTHSVTRLTGERYVERRTSARGIIEEHAIVCFFASRTPTTFIHGRYVERRYGRDTVRCDRKTYGILYRMQPRARSRTVHMRYTARMLCL